MTTRSRSRASLDRLERAAEDVVVGDRDPTESRSPPRGRADPRRDRAVVRPVGVHVQVDDDPVAPRERVVCLVGPPGPPLADEAAVERPAPPRPGRSSALLPAPALVLRRAASGSVPSSALGATRPVVAPRGAPTLRPPAPSAPRRPSWTKIAASPSAAARWSGAARHGRAIAGGACAGSAAGSRAASCAGARAPSRGGPVVAARRRAVPVQPGSSLERDQPTLLWGARRGLVSTPSGTSA